MIRSHTPMKANRGPVTGRREGEVLDLLRQRLRAVVYLAGAVRANRLTEAIERSLLDLPLDASRTLLGDWRAHVSGLAERLDRDALPIRVMVNDDAPPPVIPALNGRVAVSIEYDPQQYRGTAGLLRDVTREYGADDLVLVVGGAQLLLRPLDDLALRLGHEESDVALLTHADGTPSSVMLMRCGALERVKSRGFLDLKEQFLPELAAAGTVKVIEARSPITAPTRTLDEYIRAVRMSHLAGAGIEDGNPFTEHWQPTFGLTEEGAAVAEDARVHDSVVLAGGEVANGATVVHSVVTRSGVVSRRQMVIDEVIGTSIANGRKGRK